MKNTSAYDSGGLRERPVHEEVDAVRVREQPPLEYVVQAEVRAAIDEHTGDGGVEAAIDTRHTVGAPHLQDAVRDAGELALMHRGQSCFE